MTRRMNRIFGVATLLLAVVVISCGGQSKSPTTPTTAPIERSVNSITVTELFGERDSHYIDGRIADDCDGDGDVQ